MGSESFLVEMMKLAFLRWPHHADLGGKTRRSLSFGSDCAFELFSPSFAVDDDIDASMNFIVSSAPRTFFDGGGKDRVRG